MFGYVVMKIKHTVSTEYTGHIGTVYCIHGIVVWYCATQTDVDLYASIDGWSVCTVYTTCFDLHVTIKMFLPLYNTDSQNQHQDIC